YNFFRPSKLLGGRTPAEAAGIDFDLDCLERIKERHLAGEQMIGGGRRLFFDEETEIKLRELQQVKLHAESKGAGNLSWTDAMLFFALANRLTDE
ncbi:MAG: hypothetical protein WC749_13420, partial [Dehalococcoidia bacterium]